MTDDITVVPANEASWEDLQAVYGTRGDAAFCQCQRFKLAPKESFGSFPAEERAFRLREQTNAGDPEAETTAGLVAYLDGEPVGWCGVEPRANYSGLRPRLPRPVGRPERGQDRSDRLVRDVLLRPQGIPASRRSPTRSPEPPRTLPATAVPVPWRATR